jgi:hypothetical protein
MGPRVRLPTVLGLVIGAAAIALQFYLSMTAYLGAGRWLPDALITFFSFYTILTNLTLVLIYLSELTTTAWLAIFRHPVTRAMMVGVMLLVMGFYHLLLSGLWAPEGLLRIADVTLHYITPIVYVIWWTFVAPHGGLAWREIGIMIVPTLVYFGYILARGAIVSEYPYPILEANTLGYGTVFINAVVVAAVLAVLFALVIALDGLLARRKAFDS